MVIKQIYKRIVLLSIAQYAVANRDAFKVIREGLGSNTINEYFCQSGNIYATIGFTSNVEIAFLILWEFVVKEITQGFEIVMSSQIIISRIIFRGGIRKANSSWRFDEK